MASRSGSYPSGGFASTGPKAAAVGDGVALGSDVGVAVGSDVGSADGDADGSAVAAAASYSAAALSFVVVDVDVERGVTGWIETYLPSQTIRFGAYHHFVKNFWSWLGVSFVFGRMS